MKYFNKSKQIKKLKAQLKDKRAHFNYQYRKQQRINRYIRTEISQNRFNEQQSKDLLILLDSKLK